MRSEFFFLNKWLFLWLKRELGWCTLPAWCFSPCRTFLLWSCRAQWTPQEACVVLSRATLLTETLPCPLSRWLLQHHQRRLRLVRLKAEYGLEHLHWSFCSERFSIITVLFLHLSSLIDYQPAQRWLKLSSASDGYSSNNTLHGGKIPRRLASQMVESVWQEYNINRTGNKYVQCHFFLKSIQSIASMVTDKYQSALFQ